MFYAGRLCRRFAPGILLAWILVAPLACPHAAEAQILLLSDFSLFQQDNDLQLQFRLNLEGIEELEKLLLDGASLVLECEAELNLRKSLWLDDQISQTRLQSGVKSDSLTREFLVSLPGQDRPIKHKRLAEVLKEAWKRLGMDLGPVDRLVRGREYGVALKVRLKYADVPPWLKQTLFFWSWEAIPSTEYEMVFTY